jgi:hypothetical protein
MALINVIYIQQKNEILQHKRYCHAFIAMEKYWNQTEVCMKLRNFIISSIMIGLSSLAMHSQASISSCSWVVTSQQSTTSGTTINEACRGTENGATVTALTRTQSFGANPSCALTSYAPYSWSGTCQNPTLVVPAQSCGANSGALFGTFHPMSYSTQLPMVQAFCGACGYNIIQLNSTTLEARCKTGC